MSKKPTQIFKSPGNVPFCEIYGCQGRPKWFLGRPDGPPSTCFNLCDDCAKSVLANWPEELSLTNQENYQYDDGKSAYEMLQLLKENTKDFEEQMARFLQDAYPDETLVPSQTIEATLDEFDDEVIPQITHSVESDEPDFVPGNEELQQSSGDVPVGVPDPAPYCAECDKEFKNLKGYKSHMKMVHGEGK